MSVSLYTSRVVLNTLGVNDYGIYTIVGGIVTLFSFFNGAMATATQRFLTFDIGKNDLLQLKKTFNATLNIHIFIGVFVFLLAETFGLWFVNSKLNLPQERMIAVNCAYQFSVLTFILGVVQVPYDSLILAREKMDIYAYMSIIEVFLKLIVVYFLDFFALDKLILYTGLLFFISFIARTGRKIYCKRNYEESKYVFYFEKKLYDKLIAYSGWNLFGNISLVARGQGMNIIINLFFGTVLNAAYGITLQVQSAVNLFVMNFQMAVNPQIIKNYAMGHLDLCRNLIYQSSKFSYFMMLIIVAPIISNINFILKIWLKNPPEFALVFIKLCLLNLLIDCISGSLMTGIQATGKIKWYQIVVGSMVFLNLPIVYFLLKIYKQPELIYYTSILISFFSLSFRLYFIRKKLNISIKFFLLHVIGKIIVVSLISITIFTLLNKFIFFSNEWILCFVRIFFLEFIIICSITIFGINKREKEFIREFLFKKFSKR